jgi:hypothetical protein
MYNLNLIYFFFALISGDLRKKKKTLFVLNFRSIYWIIQKRMVLFIYYGKVHNNEKQKAHLKNENSVFSVFNYKIAKRKVW